MLQLITDWRRAVGGMFLILTILQSGMWLRGTFVVDIWIFKGRLLDHFVDSGEGCVGWTTYTPSNSSDKSFEWETANAYNFTPWWRDRNRCEITSYLERDGFSRGSATRNDSRIAQKAEFLRLPYWSLVMPSALIASLLIVWSHRMSVRTKTNGVKTDGQPAVSGPKK